MKKLLLIFYIFGFFLPLSFAQANLSQQKLERNIKEDMLSMTAEDAFADVRYLLLPRGFEFGVPVQGKIAREITWDVFERESRQAVAQQTNFRKNAFNFAEQVAQLSSPETLRETLKSSPHQGRPDYGALTKGFKYIYIAEMLHSSKTLPKEVALILQQIRAQNPNARILLALESAVLLNQLASPLLPAGTESEDIMITDEYAPVADAASRESMDILALDDAIYFTNRTTQYIKMGDTIIRFDQTAPHIQKLINNYPKEDRQYLLDIIRDFLSRSEWGVVKRNEQWARYIKTVEKNYDIIIVFAGTGHLLESQYKALPYLIAQKGISFTLASLEELSESSELFYACAEKTQGKYHTSVSNVDPATASQRSLVEGVLQDEQQQCEVLAETTLRRNIPFFLQSLGLMQINAMFLENTPPQNREVLQTLLKQNKTFVEVEINVYLPDLSK